MTPPTPPIQAGPVHVAPSPSTWPKVVGIISIILGAGGTLGGCFGLAGQLFAGAMKDFMEKITPQGPGPDPLAALEAVEEYAAWTITLQLLVLAAAVLLLIAGIGLVQRRGWSVKAGVLWAIVRIPVVVANAALGYVTFQATMEAMEAMQDSPEMQQIPAGLFSVIGSVGGVFTVALTLIWGWAYPVFILIWFSRRRIKDEVAAWA